MSRLTNWMKRLESFTEPNTVTIERGNMKILELREANAQLHVTHTVGKPQWPKIEYATFDRQAYQRMTLIYRCVNLLASSVAEAPVRVYDDQDGEQETLPDHPLRQLIARPNPQMGEAALWSSVIVRAAVFSFALVEIERGPYGRPVGLWPLRSDWARPIPRDNDDYDWEYTVPGRQPVIIEASDICVIPWAPSATGDPRGVGPLEVSLREWSLLSTMQDHLKGFFDGGALPVYGLIPDDDMDFTAEQADLIREQWIDKTTWRHGASPKPMVLKSIKGIERLSFDFDELAYTDLRDISEVAILQAFGVPGSMVGQRLAQERNTYSNYGEARRSFYQDTVQKLWSRIDDALTRSLLPEFETRSTVSLEFDTSRVDALQEDQAAVAARMAEGFRGGGVTRADYRRALGLPVVPADDVYLIPFSVIEVPIGQTLAESKPVPPPQLPAGDDSDDEPDEPTDTERQRRSAQRERRGAALQQRSLRIYTALGERFAPLLDQYFAGQRDRVVGTIAERAADGAPETRADLIPGGMNWGKEQEDLTEILVRIYAEAGDQAAVNAATETGIAAPIPDIWDISNPYLGDVRELLASRVTGITEVTQTDIQRIVTESLNEGVSVDELSDRLKGLYDETYNGRSRAIARTESMTAYNHAAVMNYRTMGFTKVELRDNPEHTDQPGSDGLTCAQRHNLVVPIESVGKHIAAEHVNGSLSISAYDDIYEW